MSYIFQLVIASVGLLSMQVPLSSGVQVDIDLSGCGTTKGCRRVPVGCDSAAECTYIFTTQLIGTDNVQIELSAKTTGWVAVGFSADNKMGGDDVFACQANDQGIVFAKNLYNPGQYNTRDAAKNAPLTNVSTSLVNGVVSCRFERSVAGSSSHDLDLSQDHTLFFAVKDTTGAEIAALDKHTVIPELSAEPIRASSTVDIGSVSFQTGLIAAHGSIMIYAWFAVSASGMFTARFMRSAYGAPRWFLIHWITMLVTVVLSLTGAIIIGVHAGTWKPTSHSGVGMAVLVLTAAQGLAAMFRPAPDADRRWMFTMFHRVTATSCQVLGWTAILLGFKEADRVVIIKNVGPIVLGAGIACLVLFWLYMEYRKYSQSDEKPDAASNQLTTRLSYLWAAVAYAFTLGSCSVLWGLEARQ